MKTLRAGVAGAGVALAMQGVLGNIVAGLTIIFTRPFRIGEYISIVGEEGDVQGRGVGAAREERVGIGDREELRGGAHDHHGPEAAALDDRGGDRRRHAAGSDRPTSRRNCMRR